MKFRWAWLPTAIGVAGIVFILRLSAPAANESAIGYVPPVVTPVPTPEPRQPELPVVIRPGMVHVADANGAAFSGIVENAEAPTSSPAIGPKTPQRPERFDPAPADSREPRLKFVTTSEGIYRVGSKDLEPFVKKMGDPRDWSLWCVDKPVPMLVSGEADGRFDRDDYIEWFAQPVRAPNNRVTIGQFDNDARMSVHDAYTTESAYFLRFVHRGKTPPARYYDYPTTIPLQKPFWPNRTFRRFRHYEEDAIRRNFRPDADAEYTDGLFWDHFSWPSLPFRHPYRTVVGLAADSNEPCSMTIKLWGMNRPLDPPEHQVDIGLNKKTIGRARWSGVREHYFTTSTLPAKMFNEWANEFMFRAVERNTTDHPDMMLLDWIEVEYPSYYRAENDWLEFTGPPLIKDLPGPYKGWLNPLTLETFRSVPVWVLDLTTGRRQVLPIGRHWKLKERDYYNAFLPVANPGDRYVAYAPRALHKPAIIKWTPADRLRASRIGAEYLVITHEKFLAEARRLADHRRKNGLRAEVVTADEIANAFNKGFSNQVGIRNFIRYAYWNWRPGPRFVLLVGDATWDDKGLTGSEFANYLPTHYYGSDALGYYASDNWFAQMDDADDFPDVAIGRLPARSVAEARAYVDKVIEQETAPTSGPWRNSALLLTSYNRQSQLLMDRLASSTLQGMRLKKSYTTPQQLARPDLPSTVTRQFGEGHAVVVFAGHGGSFVWQVGGNTGGTAALALFSPANVKKLGNKGKYPLVLALTCYTNSFDNPMQQTIGESLVLEPNRGAIAVVSASWRGALENEFPLATVLLRRVREGREKTIGEALMAAKREDMRPENVNCVCLLGDPAATVPLAPPEAAPPAAPSALAKK